MGKLMGFTLLVIMLVILIPIGFYAPTLIKISLGVAIGCGILGAVLELKQRKD